MLRLIRRGETVTGSTMCWRVGMAEWLPVSRCGHATFVQASAVHLHPWHYVDADTRAAATAPVAGRKLAEMFSEGVVDGMTMVWSQGVGDEHWRPISELPELRMVLQALDPEQQQTDEPLLQDGSSGGDAAFDPTQVYDLNKDVAGTGDPSGDKNNDAKQGGGGGGGGGESDDATAVKKRKRKNRKRPAKWKEHASTWVYCEGLPLDVSEEEVIAFFTKCGILTLDPSTGAPKVKLYRDKDSGRPKGDASICYAQEASVELCLQLLDEADLRPGDQSTKVKITRAVFERKSGDDGGSGGGGGKKPRKDRRLTKVAFAAKQQALSWAEQGMEMASGNMRIVVLKNVFSPSDFQDEEGSTQFAAELESDLRGECEEKIGHLQKITIFSKNVEGVAVLKFADGQCADQCIKLMNGRFFAGRRLSCAYWDGVTDFRVREAAEVEENRIDAFGDWLESQELPEELRLEVET